ncbi:unnamed protein product [Ectocarpus sp. 13 AM-2016]
MQVHRYKIETPGRTPPGVFNEQPCGEREIRRVEGRDQREGTKARKENDRYDVGKGWSTRKTMKHCKFCFLLSGATAIFSVPVAFLGFLYFGNIFNKAYSRGSWVRVRVGNRVCVLPPCSISL